MKIRKGTPNKHPSPGVRSRASLDFEKTFLALRESELVPLRSKIDLRQFRNFARWMVIVEPLRDKGCITMRLVGSGFFEFFGRDLTDTDYLDIVDPAIRSSAYESAIAMIDRPCGLWQQAPTADVTGKEHLVEYTAFPIIDERRNAKQIVGFAGHAFDDLTAFPSMRVVRSASHWQWIDLGLGLPERTDVVFV